MQSTVGSTGFERYRLITESIVKYAARQECFPPPAQVNPTRRRGLREAALQRLGVYRSEMDEYKEDCASYGNEMR